ncbi:GNAT family N-acetyltransferase [Patescibacteria group bacterium]
MKIISFDPKYFSQMAELFVEVFSEPEAKWDPQTAIAYLRQNTDNVSSYCFLAVGDQDDCLGGIFCRSVPYYQSSVLLVDCVQVKKEARRQGVAKALLKKAIGKAREQGLGGVQLLADARQNFPKVWYQRLGFSPTGWTEYEVKIKDLKF